MIQKDISDKFKFKTIENKNIVVQWKYFFKIIHHTSIPTICVYILIRDQLINTISKWFFLLT